MPGPLDPACPGSAPLGGMSPDMAQSLRTGPCLVNPSGLQAGRWTAEGASGGGHYCTMKLEKCTAVTGSTGGAAFFFFFFFFGAVSAAGSSGSASSSSTS